MAKIRGEWVAPDEWDRIFSSELLKVEQELNIKIDADLETNHNCLFIRICR